MLGPKIDSFFSCKAALLVSSSHSHFFFFPPFLWVLSYDTFKFSHSTFLLRLNSQKQQCSCFRWKLARLIPPSVHIELFSKECCFSAVTDAAACLSLLWISFSWVCRNVSVPIWQCVSHSKWCDLQPLDREEQKESREYNALLSTTLQAGVQHTCTSTHRLILVTGTLLYMFTLYCAL